MSQSGKELVARFYEEVANQGAIDRIDDFLTDDFVDHEPFPGHDSTREGVKSFFRMLCTAFPDVRMDTVAAVEEGDRVMVRYRMTGTHQGEFMGMPPTGRHIDVEGYDEVLVSGDRAKEHWGALDGTVLMEQLGGVPEGVQTG